MATLSRELRRGLQSVVVEAREVAEEAATKALSALAVGEREPHRSLTPEQRTLRNRLRAHGRQLGDWRNEEKGTQAIDHLVAECAYEHWHRMLFARFLAENRLLLEPESGVAISIEEVKELAQTRAQDWVVLAGQFAVPMLPRVFRQDDPVLAVHFALEDRKRLEELLESLSPEVFTANDSLGWTYQFWQSKRKEEVNASGSKIGAEELPAVTQLFTEDYIVDFLLDNTLGAWHAGKVLAANPALAQRTTAEEELRKALSFPGCPWSYLRFIKDDDDNWCPAAGTFDGWPKSAKDLKCLDPCMGSGHFVVAMFDRLVPMRVAEDGLNEEAAIRAVIADNLFGLEIDRRCTQIAAFNLGLTAWRRVGHCELPSMNLACSGLAPNAKKEEWLKLAGGDVRLKNGMERLYELFKDAAVFGSLINPRVGEADLLAAPFSELQPIIESALALETGDETTHELAVAARGLSNAAAILAGSFTLVATNVPYLGRSKQIDTLKDYCERVHAKAKADLATCFIERCLEFSARCGTTAVLTPNYWLFLNKYTALREELLRNVAFKLIARLGVGAFETISGEMVNVCLVSFTRAEPVPKDTFVGFDVGQSKNAFEKAIALRDAKPRALLQVEQATNPDSTITVESKAATSTLGKYIDSYHGITTTDFPRFSRLFWENYVWSTEWVFQQSTVESTREYGGREQVLLWQNGNGAIKQLQDAGATVVITGLNAWGKRGVVINRMNQLFASMYTGEAFDTSVAVLIPRNPVHLRAIWAFCSSKEFYNTIRQFNQQVVVEYVYYPKVPFDLAYWDKVASEKYPHGLSKPFSSDSTQWLFGGHPNGSDEPLQVAVARLLGYEWPRQAGSSFPDCTSLGRDGLQEYVDADGMVCLTSLKGEEPATERLQKLLASAYEQDWSAAKQRELLERVGFSGQRLNDWLRDVFFEQHCALFHQRPFIWHLWDGNRDGFHALVNYHKLAAPNGVGRKTLENLTYAYLGDWIGRQKAEQRQGREGADVKLAAALHLQDQLKKIIEGEPPYDLFVRWKALHEQAIGWEPDIHDGVRMNIRPFMMAATLNGKSIFRRAPKIKWEKDRGKEPKRPKEEFPWFWAWDEESDDFLGSREFNGNRWNDLHYSIDVKREARRQREEKST